MIGIILLFLRQRVSNIRAMLGLFYQYFTHHTPPPLADVANKI